MTLRADTTSLVTGALVASLYPGLGIAGVQVPSVGTDGASAFYAQLSLPADDLVEIRGALLARPSSGTFTFNEDGSFSLVGAPDGTYVFSYRLYADSADLGIVVVTIVVGEPGDYTTVTVREVVLMVAADKIDTTNPIKPRILKDPDANIRYSFDWTNPLAGWAADEVIASATFTCDPSLTTSSPAFSGATASVYVAGGVVGTTVPVTCRITTTSGIVDERSLYLQIRQR